MNVRNWAVCLVAAVLAAGCGGGGGASGSGGGTSNDGGGSSTAAVTAGVTPSSLTLSAATTDAAPSAVLTAWASNIPDGGLYVGATSTAGYVHADFDGQNIVVTGVSPATLAVGAYHDSVSVKVCLDAQCVHQVADSPISVPVIYTVTLGDPATAMPTVSALSPSTVVEGSAGFTLVVSGTNFAPTSSVQWNGQARPTTYVSANTLDVQINASDVVALSTANVTVTNASTGGGVSSAQAFSVTAPVPTVTSLSPATAATGGSSYMLTVNGTDFDSTAQVTWNGSPRQTTYLSATQVAAQINAADIAVAGNFPVAAYNADGGIAPSNTIVVTVAGTPLSLTKLAPAFVAAGGPAYVQTLFGTGFTASSAVQWNGSPRATTFVSTTQLNFQVSAADIANAGTGALTVVNGGSAPVTSNAVALTMGHPSADAVALRINPQHNGAINFATVVAPTALPLSPSWTVSLDGTVSYPLIVGGRIFVTVARGTGGSEIVALSAATGAVVWGPISVPSGANATYDNGRVMVMSSNGLLTALDPASGSQLWSTVLTGISFSSPPTAANGAVYTGGTDVVYAVDDATGAIKWWDRVTGGEVSSPTVTADGVYVSYPCETYDFSPASGLSVWNNAGSCPGAYGATGTYANGVYYSPNPGSEVYMGVSVDAETGHVIRSYGASQAPAIGATSGYILESGTLTATGLSNNTILWTFTGDGTLSTAPILVNNYLFIGSSSNKLYALDAITGAQLWQATLGGAPSTGMWSPLVQSGMNAGDGLLVVPFGSTLTAYTLSDNP